MRRFKILKRIKSGDYYRALVPNHPNADRHGYVVEHRVKIENYLGRLLNKNEIVHHKNKDTLDNRIKNLKVFKNKSVHSKFHSPSSKKIKLTCPICKKVFYKRLQFFLWKKKFYQTNFFCSRKCNGTYSFKYMSA